MYGMTCTEHAASIVPCMFHKKANDEAMAALPFARGGAIRHRFSLTLIIKIGPALCALTPAIDSSIKFELCIPLALHYLIMNFPDFHQVLRPDSTLTPLLSRTRHMCLWRR